MFTYCVLLWYNIDSYLQILGDGFMLRLEELRKNKRLKPRCYGKGN